MSVFEAVKDSVTAREAAERYGIKVNHSGMARCPFHNDRTPSMKIDKRYYCFGCQAKGDVIDLTAGLFSMPVRDAAVKLAHDFNIPYDDGESGPQSPSLKKQELLSKIPETQLVGNDQTGNTERRFLDAVWKCATVYIDYLSLLQRWHVEYAPADGEKEWHPLFREALQEETHVEYLLDVLMNGSPDDVADLIIDVGKEVNDLEKRVKEFNAGEKEEADGHD